MGQETLVFRRGGFSPPLSLLMSAFALVICPARLSAHLQPLTQRSPTTRASHKLLYYRLKLRLFEHALTTGTAYVVVSFNKIVSGDARVRSFGILLSPVTSSAQADSTSELLRFL